MSAFFDCFQQNINGVNSLTLCESGFINNVFDQHFPVGAIDDKGHVGQFSDLEKEQGKVKQAGRTFNGTTQTH
jgi:hypothetical protein